MGSDDAHDVLRFIAEGVTALSGFDVSAISIVEGDQLRTVAVAGNTEAARALLNLRAPVEQVMWDLTAAEEWGRLLFVPHERASGQFHGFEWIPDIEPSPEPDGWHPEDMLCALLRNGDGALRGVLAVDLPRNGRRPDAEQRRVLDVYAAQAEQTVVKLLERDELARDLDTERRFSRYRGDLIKMISHEVRTPTASILAYAELALTDDPAADHRAYLEAIVRGGNRITQMADSLVVMATVDDPDTPPPAASIDMVELVDDVREQLRDQAVVAGVATILTRVPPHPVIVTGAREELIVAVRNLLGNAIKYSHRGGRVRLGVRLDPHHVVLTITDEGIGISETDQERLFEEFYRAADPAAAGVPGTGLGLALVDRIMRRHHGRVDVASHLGEGTTMRLTLPATNAQRGHVAR